MTQRDRRGTTQQMDTGETSPVMARVRPRPLSSMAPPLVQRACACGSGAAAGLDERCQTCRDKALQRSATDAALPRERLGPGLSAREAAALSRLGGGRPLDAPTRSRMEGGFGFDFRNVRIHDDAEAHTAARELDARAFTHATDVAFAAGQYRPGSAVGDALIAHELAHVVQQSEGSTAGGATRGLERDADHAAIDVIAGLHGGKPRRRPSLSSGGGLALQRCTNPPEPNPEDQRVSTHLPTSVEQCEQLERLGLMPSPAPAACVAPEPPASASPESAPTPRVSARARAAAEGWDGESSHADWEANRRALKGEFFGAIDDWLREHRDAIRVLERRDAQRRPIGEFEGACRGAQMVVDRYFGSWITGAVRTPSDLAELRSWEPRATGPDRNLFDAGDPADLAAHHVSGITAQARAMRIIAQYSERARTAARTHHFSTTRVGTEEAAWLASVVTEYLDSHPDSRAPLETYSRLSIARSQPSGIWLQTYSDDNDTARLRRRWSNFKVCVHEYLHRMAHPRFRAAAGRSEHANEGFTEMFTKELLKPMLPGNVPEDVRTVVEAGLPRPFGAFDSVVIGSYSTPPSYLESLHRAERVRRNLEGPSRSVGSCTSQRDAGGNNAVKAAYFQGHVELLGLSPGGSGEGPTRATPDEVAVPEGVTTIAELAAASGLTPAEITAANPGLTDGAFPATVRLPGCREHLVVGYSSATSTGSESAAETRAQIAAMHHVTEAALDRANPGIAARGGWSSLSAGTSILIPRH